MKRTLILSLLLTLFSPLAFSESVVFIDFEDPTESDNISVYDTWENSPFRDGRLRGNIGIVDNFLKNDSLNSSNKILGLQRSRYGSNTFGACVKLPNPWPTNSNTQYVHVLIHKPKNGKEMLVGLGKRSDRSSQSPDTEQFWVYSSSESLKGEWHDAVFPVKTNDGVEIHSLVIIPDCESPHELDSDFVVYIDEIEINENNFSRIHPDTISKLAKEEGERVDLLKQKDKISTVRNHNLNGDVTLADGTLLDGFKAPMGKDLKVKMLPSNGFTYSGIRVRHGKNLDGDSMVGGVVQFKDEYFGKEEFDPETNTLVIPGRCIDGDVLIEGYFVEVKK